MALIRACIEILSPLRSLLKGDTLWGHVACGIANHEGAAAVEEFCNMAPAFAISSAFPHGMLPRPLLPPDEEEKTCTTYQEYTEMKKDKKRKYIPASTFIDEPEMMVADSAFTTSSTTRVSVSRETGGAIDGILFDTQELWPLSGGEGGGALMDIYVSTTLPVERVSFLIDWAFEFGYGADASTGCGHIIRKGPLEEVMTRKPKLNRYLALGPFVDDSSGIEDLCASTFVRKGKVGGLLATELSPYKKSVILFDEGATFIDRQHDRSIVGTVLHHMHSTGNYDICHSAVAPVIEV